jgi:two-component sensor histidine kinase
MPAFTESRAWRGCGCLSRYSVITAPDASPRNAGILVQWTVPEMLAQDPSAALVLREFHHRVANTFTVLSASLRRDLSSFEDPRLRDVLAHHEQQIVNFGVLFRFLAIGASQEALSSEAHFRPFIEALARSVLTPIGARCEAFITDDSVPAVHCERMALIITELVMNAAKYAFQDCPAGTVRIGIREDKGIWLCSVSDNGMGMMYRPKGIGSQIIDALVRTMGGRMIIRSGRWGTQVLVLFPADPVTQLTASPELGAF